MQRRDTSNLLSKAVSGAGLIYTAGLVAPDVGDGAEAQATAVLAAVDAHLTAFGGSRATILHALIHLADMADYAAVNTAWTAWLGDTAPPARTCVQAVLPNPRAKVEFTVLALADNGTS